MNENRAAIRYAKATLDYAVEKQAAEKVDADMRSMAATISGNSELQQLLLSPIVKTEVKKNALKAIFKGSNEISLGLITTLADNKRIDLLQEVAYKYIIQYEKMKGEDVATVITAVPLSEALEKKVLSKVKELTGNQVSLENKVDESIVGGFILRVGDLQYDTSVANKLNTLKREFTNSL